MNEDIRSRFRTLEINPAYQYALLAAVTLLAAVLRFYKLGEWSFWYDEMYTLRDVRNFFDLGLMDQQLSRALIYLLVSFFGESEWVARLVPALIGIATIPILYFPVRQMFGPLVALFSGLFLAVSPWHLYWSQNARFYTALLLFYSLALVTFYFAIEKDKPWYLVLFMVFLGLAVQERLFALFLVPVVAGYLLLLKLLPFEKPAGFNLRNILILVIPGLIGALVIGWEFLTETSSYVQTFSWVNNSPFWVLSGVVYYVGIPIMIMGALGAIYLLSKKDRAALLLSLAAVFPLLAIAALAFFQYTANRYAFVALTSWIILASFAVRELLDLAPQRARILALGALLLLFLEPLSEDVLYYQYQNGNRDNWKAALAFVGRHKEPGDIVVVTNTLLGDYYLHGPTVNLRGIDLDSLPQNGDRVWFVEDMNVGEKSPGDLRWIQENATMLANFDVHVRARNFKMRIYIYDPTVVSRK
jgi:uncharacterized membrane protein